ncbi:hypothetical protein [Natronosalvus rutilus]|uniref:Uncharacterized protein n=1 Tax=Natronosalvus rutilus TaxID=2953753 RepID=A0A9E7NCS8_9EURY|nr:hypothetical protein [Natronosalvus rutilus]UTF55892.1 hypothetical protein NGM29_20025 [Natronosalvus rutilus]
MVADQDGSPDLQLRFSGGHYEDHIVTAILALQVALAGVGVMGLAFVFLAMGGRPPLFVAVAIFPLALAYLLTYLYE